MRRTEDHGRSRAWSTHLTMTSREHPRTTIDLQKFFQPFRPCVDDVDATARLMCFILDRFPTNERCRKKNQASSSRGLLCDFSGKCCRSEVKSSWSHAASSSRRRYVVPKKRPSLTNGHAVDWPCVSPASYSPPSVSVGLAGKKFFLARRIPSRRHCSPVTVSTV